MKMDLFKKFMKAHWLVVWLVTAILAFSMLVSAEYIVNKNRARRVAANLANEGQQFSSNYLEPGTPELKKAAFNSGENGYCIVPVTIWNHSTTNPTKAYQGVLPYKLEAWLVSDAAGTLIAENADILTTYPIEYSTDGTTYTKFTSLTYDNQKGYCYSDNTLRFNTRDADGNYKVGEHTFYIRYPDTVLANNPALYVKVVATPDNIKDFVPISAVMGIQKTGMLLSRGWTGGFSDDKTYTDYDAFNYVMSGSGEANITLSWCTDYLELSQVNIGQYGWSGSITTNADTTIGGVTGTWKTLTLTADSDEVDESGNLIGLNRYALQFYMTGDPDTDYGSGTDEVTGFWATVNKYVSFLAD